MFTVICYKEKKTGDTYLAYYDYAHTLEEGKAIAEAINRDKPERLTTGQLAKCDEREYFASQQEPFID